MDNLKTVVKDNHLLIDIDMSKTLRKSKSGKSDIVATTGGGARIDGAEENFRLNLSAYRGSE